MLQIKIENLKQLYASLLSNIKEKSSELTGLHKDIDGANSHFNKVNTEIKDAQGFLVHLKEQQTEIHFANESEREKMSQERKEHLDLLDNSRKVLAENLAAINRSTAKLVHKNEELELVEKQVSNLNESRDKLIAERDSIVKDIQKQLLVRVMLTDDLSLIEKQIAETSTKHEKEHARLLDERNKIIQQIEKSNRSVDSFKDNKAAIEKDIIRMTQDAMILEGRIRKAKTNLYA